MTSPLQQKLKVTGPVVVTANRLADGAVIYRTAQGDWTNDLATAAVVTTAPAASELLTAALADRLAAVDAYVAPGRVDRGAARHPGQSARAHPLQRTDRRAAGRKLLRAPCTSTTTSTARLSRSACANSATRSAAACPASSPKRNSSRCGS